MEAEFTRYGLDKYRILVGYLQLLGGIGLLVGLKIPLILTVSAGGLSLLMLMGFLVRIKMKDSFLLSLPSFLFMILNCYIFLLALRLVNLPK
ncbi:DoxX family protein [Pedobacter mucosus]|nr:DoxX family protein [Pedobacter mucosus]